MSTLYKIKLQNFEGPLDLLLFFVRKDELNIYDIPLARITKSYLEYLQLMQDLNLDIASEFILMAATLMRIKVRMMLPKDPVDEEEEDMMDPREELSRRLIEYRQFKEASKSLSELDEYWRQVYRRSYFNFDLLPQNGDEVIGLKDISFFDLLAAYKKALEKKPLIIYHNVERLNVTVEDQQKYIMDFFRDRNCYLFTELCDDMAKIEIVVTFLALLDLVKRAEIAIKQASIFDDIWIYKASEFQDEVIPEEERVDTNINEVTGPVGSETTLDETGSILGQERSDIEATTAVSDVGQSEVSSGALTSPAEIEVEFVENGINAFEVTDDQVQMETESMPEVIDTESVTQDSEQKNDEPVLDTEILNENSFEPELNSSNDKDASETVIDEIDHLMTLNRGEEITNEEIIEVHTDEILSVDEKAEVRSEVDSEAESIDLKVEVEVNAEELMSEETVLENNTATETSDVIQSSGVSNSIEDEPSNRMESETDKDEAREKIVSEFPKFESVKDVPPVESAEAGKQAEPKEKVPRWKSFLHRIVSIVRKIFYK